MRRKEVTKARLTTYVCSLLCRFGFLVLLQIEPGTKRHLPGPLGLERRADWTKFCAWTPGQEVFMWTPLLQRLEPQSLDFVHAKLSGNSASGTSSQMECDRPGLQPVNALL